MGQASSIIKGMFEPNPTSREVLLYALAFTSLYKLSGVISPKMSKKCRELNEPDKAYWNSMVVSLVHALIVGTISLKEVTADPSLISTGKFDITTPGTELGAKIFLGYILYDLVYSLKYWDKWPGHVANLIHHIFASTTWAQFIYFGHGHTFALIGALCEWTTPFVDLRWFLDKLDMKSSPLYLINGLTMLILWFIFRVVLYSYGMYIVYKQSAEFTQKPMQQWLLMVVAQFIGWGLQLMWFSKILKGALKAVGIGGKKKKGSGKKQDKKNN